MDDLSMLDGIRANAKLITSMAHEKLGQQITYDKAGVEWLDGYIQRQHEQGDPAIHDGLVNTLGSYVGECIIQNIGGQWAETNGNWYVRFDDRNAANLFAKVGKQLENGEADSVLGFYNTILVIFQGKVSSSKKPWWKFW